MKKKMFIRISVLCLICTLLASFLTYGISYKKISDSVKAQIRNEAIFIAGQIKDSSEENLNNISGVNQNTRLTLIDNKGNVLFDSVKDNLSIENHLDRPEIQEALKIGAGEGVRYSNTLGEKSFYYAIRLESGNILRISITTDSIFSQFVKGMPYMILIIIVISLLSMYFATKQIDSIISPINNLDLDAPLGEDYYEELSPLLYKIYKQNIKIEKQVEILKDKEREFSDVTENMLEGVIVLDKRGNILFLNEKACEIFAIDKAKAINKNYLTLNRSIFFKSNISRALKGESIEYKFDLGSQNYEFSSSPVLKKDRLNGTLILIKDITQKIQIESMRKEFSANVSHELKTPLTSILGYAEIMSNGIVKPGDIKKISNKIYLEAKRLIDLVEDILKLSQLDEGRILLTKEEVDLSEVSKDVAQRLHSVAINKNIKINILGNNAIMLGNKKLLDEMVFNLIENAIKYSLNDSTININLGEEKDELLFSVEDNGIGIPKEDLDRIFERFYRVDKSHSKETGGTGLGLSIVKHIALYHNGEISIESEIDKGTTVKINFPKTKKG